MIRLSVALLFVGLVLGVAIERQAATAPAPPVATAQHVAPPVVHVHEPAEVRAAAGRFFRELDPDALEEPHVSVSFATEPPRAWAFIDGTFIVADCTASGCFPRCSP